MSSNSDDFGTQQFKDRPDMSMLLLRAIDRLNISSGAIDGAYPEYVQQLLINLPLSGQQRVTAQEDLYTTEKPRFEYIERHGRKLGTEHDPLLFNELIPVKRYPDGSIDWDDPNIKSPKRKIVLEYDYKRLNQIVMVELQNSGLTYRSEALNAEYGAYPEIENEIDLGTPTPVDDPKKNEPQEQNPLHQKCWINYKGTPKLVTNFRGYAVGINEGEKPWFFNSIAIREKKQEPIVGLFTATQGKGKTYCAIRLAEIFDKRFDPDKQIVMDRTNILKLVSGRGHIRRNQVIIIDESQWGASAREWGNKDQIKLMKFLAAARFKGFKIFIVALHRSMLDSIIRERIINYHIHMEERGRATVYEPRHQRFDEYNYPTRMGGLLLQLPDYDRCNYVSCLTCEYNQTCQSIRARYERNKSTFIEEQAEKDERAEMQQAAQEMSERDLADLCLDHLDKIEVNNKGFFNPDDIRYVLLDEYDLDISRRKATRVRAFLMRKAPTEKT